MFSKHDQIRGYDDELLAAMDAEEARQEDHLELIASENYTSKRVMQAQGSGLTNKYAEGYPGKRYYGGCEHVDKVEQLAIDRARQLFGADYANVQPHSGSSANAAVYLALLNAGDTILGMSLAHGGHLTHGAKVSSSGKLYNAVQYGLDTATGLIDYDEVERLAVEHKPKMIVAGFSAYSKTSTSCASAPSPTRSAPTCSSTWPTSPAWSPPASTRTRSLRRRGHHHHPQDPARPARRPDPGARQRGDREEAQLRGIPRRPGRPADARDRGQGGVLQGSAGAGLQDYQAQVIRNAKAMAEVFIGRSYDVVSGGTDNHLMLISLVRQGLTGKEADAALGRVGITVNKNAVPNDPQSPFVTSGIRIGTPAITTRGLQEAQSRELAGWICDILDHLGDADVEAKVATQVAGLCADFPVYR